MKIAHWRLEGVAMISKKRLAAYVLVSVVTIIAVPLLIDWFIIGNNVPSHISNSSLSNKSSKTA